MNKRLRFCLLTLLLAPLTAATSAFGQSGDYPLPDAPLSRQLCMTCHGAYGQGSEVIGGPNLTGMESWYLRRQLQNFRAGLRGNSKDYIPGYEMHKTAAALTDADIEALVESVARWPTASAIATVSGDAAAGATLYGQSCLACHGEHAEGNELLGAPALVNRNDWYLLNQLKLFKSGKRGSHPDDKAGASMRSIMGAVANEAAMLNVVTHISSLANSHH